MTGQLKLAQQFRWAVFEKRLAIPPLRAYLKRLPGFQDVEAEDRSMQHAASAKSFAHALLFFHQWPNPTAGAALVLARSSEIDGNIYYLLDPVARQIEGKHPLAATLLRRAMIGHILEKVKTARYKHAVWHLRECASVASEIQNYRGHETHEAFASRLRAQHGRKPGLWGLMDGQ